MKNTKLTKAMKYRIAQKMYTIYQHEDMTYWCEFTPYIKSTFPITMKALNWETNAIEKYITDSRWFRNYIRIQKFR